MFRTILVPLNGTAAAEVAVPYAVEEARRHCAQLVLVQIVPRPELPTDREVRGGPVPIVYACSDEERACLQDQARRYLRSVLERHRLGFDTILSIQIGDPYLRLKAAIERYAAPLVIVASAAARQVHAEPLPNAVSQLLRDGVVPVLVVRQGRPIPVDETVSVPTREPRPPAAGAPEWQVLTAIDARVVGAN
jgi:nucleotide-binding universal stress UspA family protein